MRFTVWGVAVWGVVCGGLGGRGLEINIIKIQNISRFYYYLF